MRSYLQEVRGRLRARIAIRPAATPMLLAVVATVFAMVGKASTAQAQWAPGGIPIALANPNRAPSVIISDGSGGAVIVLLDWREGQPKVYAQRLNSSGLRLWTDGGVKACSAPGWQEPSMAIPDGTGGAIIAWFDARTTGTPEGQEDIYAQRINGQGQVLWAAEGVAICTAPNNQSLSGIVSDGSDGAIITWQDERLGSSQQAIYAQHVDGSGNVHWPVDGALVCSAPAVTTAPQMVLDGVGGAVLAWFDGRNGTSDIYAQRIGALGQTLWQPGGVPVSLATATALGRAGLKAVSDGSGGMILAWCENTSTVLDIYVQHINHNGQVLWRLGGVPVCTVPGAVIDYDEVICADGQGGATLAWTDNRTPYAGEYTDIYAQHITADGSAAWAVDGMVVCNALQCQAMPAIASDDAGGAIVTWRDVRNSTCNGIFGDGDIYASRLTASGGVASGWPVNGLAICGVRGSQQNPIATISGQGGAIITWIDERYDYQYDTFAQRVSGGGVVGAPGDETLPAIVLVPGICDHASMWDAFKQYLLDDGYPANKLYTIELTPYDGHPGALSARLDARLRNIPDNDVAVVAFSMGGLVARDYIAKRIDEGDSNKVRTLITFGTPHHGSDFAAWINKHETLKRLLSKRYSPLRCEVNAPGAIDFLPGSDFLNGLNYGAARGSWDTPAEKGGRSWDGHAQESLRDATVKHYTISGTFPACATLKLLSAPAWLTDQGVPQLNDGAVATTGNHLYDTQGQVRNWTDGDLGIEELTHAIGGVICGTKYAQSRNVAVIVGRILRGNIPAGGIATETGREGFLGGVQTDGTGDSLSDMPAIEGTLATGQAAERGFVLPAASALRVFLASTDAHLQIRNPEGALLSASDTSHVGGLQFAADPDGGLEGFILTNPPPGSWELRVDGTGSNGDQAFLAMVEFISPRLVRLEASASPGTQRDSALVSAQVDSAGAALANVSWNCSVMLPDSTTSILTLLDDGAHGDGVAGDGVFGAYLHASGPEGLYQITAQVTLREGTNVVASSSVELGEANDLAVRASEITLSQNSVSAGDSVQVLAIVHNYSPVPTLGARVEVWDDPTVTLLGTVYVDIASSSSAIIQAPWKVAAPDTHMIRVTISPFSMPSEADYSNNTALKQIVLGEPITAVEFGKQRSELQLSPPAPNPFTGHVQLRFTTAIVSPAALEISDIMGRRLRGWAWPRLPAGPHEVEWDGRTDNGSPIPPSVLFYRLQSGGRSIRQKMIRLR